MSVVWTYGLIAIIYIVIIALDRINKKIEAKFQDTYANVKVYQGKRNDFFVTVAIGASLITTIINIMSLVGGNAIQYHTIIISLLILGMLKFTRNAQILIGEGHVCIAGSQFAVDNTKEFFQKVGRSRSKNVLTFNKSVNGYDSIDFSTSNEDSQDLSVYFQNYKAK